MEKCSAGIVPIQKGDKFSQMQCPKNNLERKAMESIPYASVVGSLMYAQTCTRPDISFAVGMLGRYQSNPGMDHWKAAKKVLRLCWLCGLKKIHIWLLVPVSRRSSIMKEWKTNFISGFGVVDSIAKPLRIFCDNSAAVFFSKNEKYSKGAKHMDLKYLFVKEEVQKHTVSIEHIVSENEDVFASNSRRSVSNAASKRVKEIVQGVRAEMREVSTYFEHLNLARQSRTTLYQMVTNIEGLTKEEAIHAYGIISADKGKSESFMMIPDDEGKFIYVKRVISAYEHGTPPPPGAKISGEQPCNPATKQARSSHDVGTEPTADPQGEPAEAASKQEPKNRSFKEACMGKGLSWQEVIGQLDFEALSLEQENDDGSSWPALTCTKDQFREVCEPWRKTLIVKILGKALGFNFLQQRLKQLWNFDKGFSLVDLGNDFYLTEGPWMVAGHYLTVRRWKPLFRPFEEAITTAPVWIRLPGLPTKFFSYNTLYEIGNLVGQTIKIDATTQDSARGKFARVYVEVDLKKPLKGGVRVGLIRQPVEYEGLHNICFGCDTYGHAKDSPLCPMKEDTMNNPTQNHSEGGNEAETRKEKQSGEASRSAEVGPWMTVQRRKKTSPGNKGQAKSPSPHQEKAFGSRVFKAVKNIPNPNQSHAPSAQRQIKGKDKALQEITNQRHLLASRPGPATTPTHVRTSMNPLKKSQFISVSAKSKLSSTTNPPPIKPKAKNIALPPNPSPPFSFNFDFFSKSPSQPLIPPSSSPIHPLPPDPDSGGTDNECHNEKTCESPTVDMDESMPRDAGGMLHVMDLKIWKESVDSMEADFTSNPFPMKILLWNVRGAGSGEFLRIIKDLIRQHRPSIVGIMETRIGQEKAEKVVKKIGMPRCHIVEGLGFAGGIWLLWDDKEVDVQIDDSMFQAVTISVKQNNNEWNFTTIYGSPAPTNREELWNYLGGKSQNIQGSWLVGGGFNSISSSADKSNFSSQDTNSQWKMQFPEAIVRHLPRVRSDHCPLLLDIEGFQPPPTDLRPFRFQAAWQEHEKFNEFVSAEWERNEGNAIAKLQDVGKALITWNHEKEYEDILKREEIIWFQKSRAKWINSGDINTSYFHTITLVRRSKNRVGALKNAEGEWITDKEQLKQHAVDHFQKLYTREENERTRPELGIAFHNLPQSDIDLLHSDLQVDEIEQAIKSIGTHKAPGPDGFHAIFFQKN
ncbi:Endonuclease/exonuclease/phosphatase [Corchorus capsularis]|uniref:Endonuclease/exonuclease/phosphatase n=1 Tax=Corchorus capsularis TaxID=210143 RepID=A0A1R3J0S4_COCAP|nr:Endonuclease/exonuclease/phosphatase [Corchorus capsularis]